MHVTNKITSEYRGSQLLRDWTKFSKQKIMDCTYWEHKSNNKTVAKELLDHVTADIVVGKTKMNVVSTRQRKKKTNQKLLKDY